MRLMLAIALGVGASVAVSGSIAFVGLVVPHILRPWTGGKPSRLLLPSALAGAALLTAADILVRIIPSTNELRLGVVTAFLGTPFFLHLLLRRPWPIAGHERDPFHRKSLRDAGRKKRAG